MIQGAIPALIFIFIFMAGVDETDPSWHRFWMIRPLLIVPFAGAMGGVAYYFLDHLRFQGGWKEVAAFVLSLIVYLVGLFMGFVLGLDGTLWN